MNLESWRYGYAENEYENFILGTAFHACRLTLERFKSTYELLNLTALKILILYKIKSMGKIFCVEFQRETIEIPKFQARYLIYTLKDFILIQCSNFKSS